MKIKIAAQEFEVVRDPLPGFWTNTELGWWEPYTFPVFDKYVPKDGTYLDLGAWIGPTALYASRIAKRCIAVEPDPFAFDHLEANVLANGSAIELLNMAVMDYDGTVQLGSGNLGDSVTRVFESNTAPERINVPCHTLRKLVATANISGPLFIKMDVEGSEEFILRDVDFFAEHKPTLYLSLHPFWFKDPARAVSTIDRIGKLYAHRQEIAGNTFLFTDQS
jgi:FkbM family methyltransferase